MPRAQKSARSLISRRMIAEALLSGLSPAERIAIGRELLITTTNPALFADLSAAARDIEAAALRLARIGFEREC